MVTTQRNFVFGAECKKLLQEAVQKHLPVKVTNKQNDRWQVYKSNLLGINNQNLIIAVPTPDMADNTMEPTKGQEVALTFKKGYHKCLFITRVVSRDQFELEPGIYADAMTVVTPQQIEKIQRRAFNRSPAPPGESISVEFCATPSAQSRSTSTYVLGKRWQGVLHDLSAGGLGVIVPKAEMPDIKLGDQFEVCFVPLSGQQSLILQARFRHATDLSESGMVMLGFQIVGMEMSEEGRNMLRRISRIVNVYQRMSKMPLQSLPDS